MILSIMFHMWFIPIMELLFLFLIEGTQPGFPFPNSGDSPGTPMDLKKKKNLSFYLNLFKSEYVEQTHLCSYVFH